MTGDPDAIHAKWCEAFKSLSDQVYRLHWRSQIYEPIDEAIVKQRRPGWELVINALRTMYAETQAMCIRRLVDTRRGQWSFQRLLNEMAQNPTVLSRRRWVAHYQRPDDPEFLEYGNHEFDEVAGVGRQHLPKAVSLECPVI